MSILALPTRRSLLTPRHSAIWTPASLTGLAASFRADSGAYKDARVTPVVDNDPLYEWDGQDGTTRNLVQATLANRPIYRATAAGVKAMQTNGTNQYVRMASAVVLPATGATISCWFQATVFGRILMSWGGDGGNGRSYVSPANATTIEVQGDAIGQVKDFTCPPMTVGTWYHLAVFRTAAGTTRVYLNGVESSSGAQAISGNLTLDQFGKYSTGGAGFWWSGYYSDIILCTADNTASLAQIYSYGQH